MIKQEQLNAIKERVANATPGPWLVEESRYEGRFNAASADENYDLPACLMGIEDAEFVTHAREDVPALVAEVERLREALEFYAEETKYERVELCNGDKEIYIERDGGEIARQALGGVAHE